jgi:tetratricopeptide (TPR) repeat protein
MANEFQRKATSAAAPVTAAELVSSGHILLCAGAVFCVSLLLYGLTLAPTVTLIDSGELIVAVRNLGVAHPPGFPLYLVLAHLASLVPLGNIAARIHFASALFAALASAAVTLVMAELLITAQHRSGSQARRKNISRRSARKAGVAVGTASPTDGTSNKVLVLIPALTAGLVMAFSRTLWSYATIAEVYSLNTLFVVIIFFLMLRWRRRIVEARTLTAAAKPPIADYDYLLYTAAVLFGLALGVHHVTVGLTLPAIAVIAYRTEGPRFFVSGRLLYAAVLSFAALLAVYAYLPLAAARSPILNWGDPRSLQAIWSHVTGKQYQVFFSFASQSAGAQLLEFGKLAARQLGPWGFPLGAALVIAGLANTFKHARTTFWMVIVMIACDMAYSLSYTIEEDKDAYYLPTFIALIITIGFGLGWLLRYALARPLISRRPLIAAVLAGLILPGLSLAGNWPYNNRRHYWIAHDYVANILGVVEPNALLLNQDWQVQSPMIYTREVEQLRRDVKVVDLNLMNHSWYIDYLREAYPDLIRRSRDKVDAFVTQLVSWERDPALFQGNPARLRLINLTFNEMCQAFVTNELKVAPVYMTSDLLEKTPQNKEVTEWLIKTFQLVPRGLVFQLFADQDFHAPGQPGLQTRGLKDGTLSFEKDDVVKLKVLPVYTRMLFNRGRYLAAANQHSYAIDAYRQALKLDPDFETARLELGKSLEKVREAETAKP